MRFKLSALAVLSLFAHSAFGFEPFTIQNIRIEGAERTEAGTIYNYLPVHVGETFDRLRAQQGVAALFATGFFSDVRLEVEGSDVVVVVQERPVISKLTLIGIKAIPDEDLRKSLKSIGLSEARVFDQSTLDAAALELRQQYHSRGKYSASVVTKTVPAGKGALEVIIEASEGTTASIVDINIIGNKNFKEEKLLGKIDQGTAVWWKPFSSADEYSKVRLQSDEEKIRSFYLNNGYIQFDMLPSLVTISPDRHNVYITMLLSEGSRYTFNDIKFYGESPLSETELKQLTAIEAGEVFSREKITSAISKITDRLGDHGYAFASVNPIPEINSEKNTVNFVFYIDIGRRFYVDRINVTGNSATRDEVIRRELRQMESAKYSTSKIKRSKERLDLLGYFGKVDISPAAVQGASDLLDLDVKVTEKKNGNIQLGLGFSQGQGLVLNAGISQSNVFGSGNRLDLKLNGSKLNRTYSLSYTNPYWTQDGISRSFDLYQRYVDPTSIDLGSYTTETIGTKVRFGVPISETNSIYYGLGVESQRMRLYENSPTQYYDFTQKHGDSYKTILATIGWSSDGRDSYISPTKGTFQNLSLEAGTPAGDIKYYKINYQHQWFYPLSDSLTFMANGELGYANGYSGQELPFYLNFYGGGVQSVRGYKSGSLGPRDASNNSLGGDRRVNGNVELLFPFPGDDDIKAVRPSLFIDGGWVYGAGETLDLGQLRYSAGAAISWVSPLGPMKFSLGYPLNKKEGDKTETFQFTLGNIF